MVFKFGGILELFEEVLKMWMFRLYFRLNNLKFLEMELRYWVLFFKEFYLILIDSLN